MKTIQPKRAIVRVTDPDEIAAIERMTISETDMGIVGGKDAHGHWAYKFSAERFRALHIEPQCKS